MTVLTTESRSRMQEACRPGLVSVIIPSFNRATLVTRTLDSVFSQTYRPIELFVVDDGSTDESPKIMESWAMRHRGNEFVIHVICQPNLGAPAARNRGLIECTGEYVQFLDSDDRLLAEKLAVQVDCLRSTGADYCYARTEGIDKYGICHGMEGRPEYPAKPWIVERSWHTSSPLYTRRVICSIGSWNESLRVWQDIDYSARVKAAGFHGVFLNKPLCQSIEHDGLSISRQRADVYIPAALRAVDFLLPLVPGSGKEARTERNRLAQHLVSLALRYVRQGEIDLPRLCLAKASSISRGVIKLPLTLLAWTCRMVPPRSVLEVGWSIARVLKSAGKTSAAS